MYGLRAVVNRCGVIAGPGQFGKVDQGVFTLWVARHFFGGPLKYTGFGGTGKQVRDLLHPHDLYQLVSTQAARLDECAGKVYNVGGGRKVSTSLRELTALCREVVGREVAVEGDAQTSAVDIPLYVSDHRRASGEFAWEPQRTVRDIVEDIFRWLRANEATLKPLFT